MLLRVVTASSYPTTPISTLRQACITFMEGESYKGVSIQLFLRFTIIGGRLSLGSTAIIYSFECHASEALIEICSGHIEIILRQMSSLSLPRTRSVVGCDPGSRV